MAPNRRMYLLQAVGGQDDVTLALLASLCRWHLRVQSSRLAQTILTDVSSARHRQSLSEFRPGVTSEVYVQNVLLVIPKK